MARIAEQNPRYRTKPEIAKDLAYVLKSPVTYGTKFAVAREIAAVWTEFHGKINGCPYWTKNAILQRQSSPKTKLMHEHAVPKKVVIDMLFSLEEPSADEAYELLDRFLIGVVVTPAEDKLLNVDHRSSMPEEFYDLDSLHYHDPWLRYRPHAAKRLRVMDQRTGDQVI